MKSIRNQRGVALMGVLVAVTVLGLMSGIAGMTWTTKVHRAKEQELLWRGNQYRQAIESYYTTDKVGNHPKQLPSSLENLLKDPRSLAPVRHLRKLYLDPITEDDWVVIKGPGGKILGVRSSSTDEPFKKEGFDEVNEKFSGKESYKEWEFVFDVKAADKKIKQQQRAGAGGTQGGSEGAGAPGAPGGILSSPNPSGNPLTESLTK